MRTQKFQHRKREDLLKYKLTTHKMNIRTIAISEITNTASYISDMTQGLVPLAKSSNFEFLSCLLKMARYEAESYIQDPPDASSVYRHSS